MAGFTDADVIRISAKGSTVAIYRNGAQIASVTDTSLTIGTKAAIYANTVPARFDNFASSAS